jgi:fluoroacetyl-CoA thioesterase
MGLKEEDIMQFEPGLVGEFSIIVKESDTARAEGSEKLPLVFSTPRLVGCLERAAHLATLPRLGEGQTGVGTLVNIRHLAATPVGMQARFRAELVAVDGRRLCFKVEAWDEVEKIAEGEHERFIIDIARFNERMSAKQKNISNHA